MIKIVSLVAPEGGGRSKLMNQFFDTLPAGFQEVYNPEEADIYFAHCNEKTGDIYLKGFDPNNLRINLNTVHTDSFRTLGRLLDIPGILYFDRLGSPDIRRDDLNTYPDFVRAIDIPVASVELPSHGNAFKTHFVDERRFYVSHRYKREAKHLVLPWDQLLADGIINALTFVLEKGRIDKIIIAGIDAFQQNLGFTDEIINTLKPYQAQIEFERVQWSSGVCNLLNRVGFYLSSQPKNGVELMGVEAGMCGAQPIYPDIPYYRDMFEMTDIVFFDIENPTESLDNILSSGFQWDEEKRGRFLDRCSGQRNLPAFWEHVRKVISNK